MAEIDALDCGFVASTATKSVDLPWDQAMKEVSEVSDDDMGDGKGQRRRRRRRRKGKGKGKNKGAAVDRGGKGGKNEGSTASRWSDMLSGLS